MEQPSTKTPNAIVARSGDEVDVTALCAIAAGDRAAFDEMYRRYYPRLMDFLARVVSHRELAEEIVNDTMYTVWTAGNSFAGRSKVSTWVFGIAYKKALKRLSRDKRQLAESLDDHYELAADTDPAGDANLAQLRSALERALVRLSPAHRSVVELTYLLDYSYDEIARIVGCPVNTVKTRMFHARAHLRRLLGALVGK